MIFLKDFYTPERKINTANKWVWIVHLFSYMYVIHVYFFTDARMVETSDSTKMWIPLDILLTFNISLYQVYYNMEELARQKAMEKKFDEHYG